MPVFAAGAPTWRTSSRGRSRRGARLRLISLAGVATAFASVSLSAR